MRYTCWPGRLPIATTVVLAVGVLRLLRGDVAGRGVLPPEVCYEPEPFFVEMLQYAKDDDQDRPVIGESLEWLS